MAGGNWEKQNKVLSGSYINVETDNIVATGLDSRGAIVIPMKLDWGESEKFIKVSPLTRFKEVFGKDLKDLLPIKEAFKATARVIVYNLNGEGDKATATSGEFVASALFGGSDGNKISVTVAKGLDGKSTVRTFFEGARVDSQVATTAAELLPNNFATFSGELPVGDATMTLANGTTLAATNDSFASLAQGLGSQRFKTLAYGTDDKSVQLLLSLKVKQWREEEGKNVAFITNDYNDADHEGVVSIKNGVYVGEEFIPAKDAVYWYGAAYANSITDSLTYRVYPGATDVEPLDHEQQVAAKKAGHVVFILNEGQDGVDRIVVESDINTFRSFTPKKNQDFGKGLIVRQMDILENNVRHIHSTYYIGKVKNNPNGRNLFKGALMTDVLDEMENKEAIEPYLADEIIIDEGSMKDATLVDVGVKFVDAMEKLYMTVHCK